MNLQVPTIGASIYGLTNSDSMTPTWTPVQCPVPVQVMYGLSPILSPIMLPVAIQDFSPPIVSCQQATTHNCMLNALSPISQSLNSVFSPIHPSLNSAVSPVHQSLNSAVSPVHQSLNNAVGVVRANCMTVEQTAEWVRALGYSIN